MVAEFTLGIILFLLLSGCVVGFVSAFFGVGGCFIMVPVMIFCFNEIMGVPVGLATKVAFGTNMGVVVPTALSGALKHRKQLLRSDKTFPTKNYVQFIIPVGVGSVLGSIGAYFAPGALLKVLFGIICIIGAYQFMTAAPKPIETLEPPELKKYATAGIGAGGIAHFMGIGGGLVYMPVLNTILGVPIRLAVAISVATMVIGSSVGAFSFGILGSFQQTEAYPPWSFGWFNLVAFLTLASTSVLFAQLGATATHKIAPKRFKVLLAFVYFYVGLRLIGVFKWLGLPI